MKNKYTPLALTFWVAAIVLGVIRYLVCYSLVVQPVFAVIPRQLYWLAAVLFLLPVSTALFGAGKSLSAGRIKLNGAYAFVAHPFYFYIQFWDIIFFCYAPLDWKNVLSFLVFQALAVLTGVYEEKELVERFGESAKELYRRNLSYSRLFKTV
jgi:protein-S-isoprenylcysteine O-methyltransferase Ste14